MALSKRGKLKQQQLLLVLLLLPRIVPKFYCTAFCFRYFSFIFCQLFLYLLVSVCSSHQPRTLDLFAMFMRA